MQILVLAIECYCDTYLKMWKQLWNCVIGTCCKSFEVHTRNTDIKGILERFQMKMRNMFLETGEKAVLVTECQRTWLNCVLVFCGR